MPVGTRNIRDIIRKSPPPTPEDEQSYALFEDLVARMLALNPDERITPAEALLHPFITRGDGSRHGSAGVDGARAQVEELRIGTSPACES